MSRSTRCRHRPEREGHAVDAHLDVRGPVTDLCAGVGVVGARATRPEPDPRLLGDHGQLHDPVEVVHPAARQHACPGVLIGGGHTAEVGDGPPRCERPGDQGRRGAAAAEVLRHGLVARLAWSPQRGDRSVVGTSPAVLVPGDGCGTPWTACRERHGSTVVPMTAPVKEPHLVWVPWNSDASTAWAASSPALTGGSC